MLQPLRIEYLLRAAAGRRLRLSAPHADWNSSSQTRRPCDRKPAVFDLNRLPWHMTDNGFSVGGLVSNLVGFYRALYPAIDFIRICEPVSKEESPANPFAAPVRSSYAVSPDIGAAASTQNDATRCRGREIHEDPGTEPPGKSRWLKGLVFLVLSASAIGLIGVALLRYGLQSHDGFRRYSVAYFLVLDRKLAIQ